MEYDGRAMRASDAAPPPSGAPPAVGGCNGKRGGRHPRLPLRSLGVAGLLAGILACAGEVESERAIVDAEALTLREAGAESGRVLDALRDIGADAAEEALAADRALAEQGNAGAQARLAETYYLGSGVARDFGEALRWARLAAEQGDPRGQSVLAAAYNTGSGVARDFGEALRWARLAAEQGDARGQVVLGYVYFNGNGVEQDDEAAARWAQLSAEQGHAGAQIMLGMMYASGRGVEQDDVSSWMWLTLGGGHATLQAALARRMTPERIAEAEARARDWTPTRSAAF